jgi:hypothetical protein
MSKNTPASRQLLNITKEMLDHCEGECARLNGIIEFMTAAAAEENAGKLDEITRLRAINADLLAVLQECADDLAELIESEYGNTQDVYPSQRRRYERDIAPVLKARAAIAKATGDQAKGTAENRHLRAINADLLEALRRVDHTMTVHGKVDAETPLHEFVRAAIDKAAPA